jgi:murein DD-endopeptidase MepM/ murein hydrolase activator NlpD
VVLASTLEVRGNTLVLDHGAGVFSTYAHLDELRVREGDQVKQGDTIAIVGSTGFSTGPHLHWELWVAGANVDPEEWAEREIP